MKLPPGLPFLGSQVGNAQLDHIAPALLTLKALKSAMAPL